MSKQSTALRVAAILFAIFTVAHLLRLLMGANVIIGTQSIAAWVSAPVALMSALLCIWFWKLS